MKFKISTHEFKYLINKCFSVVSQKPTMPILGNLLVEAANGMVKMTASDMTVGLSCFMPAEVMEEGTTTLPSRKLADLVRELTAKQIELTTGPNEIAEILADSSRFRINGMSGILFPALPNLEGAVRFSIKQKDLQDVLASIAFAVSREDNRYVLTGAFLQIEQGRATLFGTDGKRLSRAALDIDLDKSFSGNFVIPIKAVEEIIKNLMEEGEATLFLMSDKVAVQTADTLLVSKLLVGDYPDVKRLIPAQPEKSIALHREELTTLLRQVALFTPDGYHVVRLLFEPGELKISASATTGDGHVSMPVNYQGEKMEVAFNPTYFLDILRHSREEAITLSLIDSFNPGIITNHRLEAGRPSFEDANPLFVLMPMRVQD